LPDPIRITSSDLHSPEVEQYVELQRYLTGDQDAAEERPWLIRVIYANWFYLSVSAMIGGLVGWAILEPWFDDYAPEDEVQLSAILLFPTVAASVGLFLGAAEGIICRNLLRAIKCGMVGLGVGFLGGVIALIPAGLIFAFMSALSLQLWKDPAPDSMPTGLALLGFVRKR